MANNCCSSETITSLVQAVNCTKPPFCPPCVEVLEEELLALINANAAAIELINNGESDNILANWLFNT